MKCWIFGLVVVVGIFVMDVDASIASITTFDVNVSGVDTNTLHTVAVGGTITLDPETDVITSSSLFLYHHTDPGIALQPLVIATPDLDWEVDNGILFISRSGVGSGYLAWTNAPPNAQFRLGSGVGKHELFYRDDLHFGETGREADDVTLKPASGPDGPFGFKVGTVIPEPTSLIVWSLLGALTITVGWWRRRRAA